MDLKPIPLRNTNQHQKNGLQEKHVTKNSIKSLIEAAYRDLSSKLSQLEELKNEHIDYELNAREQLTACCREMRAEIEQREIKQKGIQECLKNL